MEKNYYFVGIKGTGMAALARVLHDRGCHVEGSDIEKETFTQAPLEQAGIQIHDFDPANIKPGMTIVQGNAFSDDQPEIVRAKELGDKVQSYPATVEELVEQYTSIGVAGAHGKTSTTALLSHVLSSVAPTTYLIGDGEGVGTPDSRFFVFEADEYRDHFLAYHPDYAIMTCATRLKRMANRSKKPSLPGVMMKICASCSWMYRSITTAPVKKTTSVRLIFNGRHRDPLLKPGLKMRSWASLKFIFMVSTVS